MTSASLQEILSLDQKAVQVFLITVDPQGEIQIEPVVSVKSVSPTRLNVKGWFGEQTMAFLKTNSQGTLLILNLQTRQGYEIRGQGVAIKDFAFLDGLAPIEKKIHFPQVERELTLEINQIKELTNMESRYADTIDKRAHS